MNEINKITTKSIFESICDSPLLIFIAACMFSGICTSIYMTYSFWYNRTPSWLTVCILLSIVFTIVGASINKNWNKVCKILCRSFFLMGFVAISSLIIESLPQPAFPPGKEYKFFSEMKLALE